MIYKLSRIIPVLICAAVLLLAGIITVSAQMIPGDADSDGEVTSIDVTCIQRVLAELEEIDSISKPAADIDGNDEIEITDATFIQRWLAELDTPYPIGPQPTEAPTMPSEAPTQFPTDSEGWGTIIYRP